MAKIQYTKDQQNAINHSGANLLVAAAAGSGKTAVVAQRAVKLLVDNKVPVNKLLLITFTRAAAAEMRQRVAKVIKERIKKESTPFLKKQLRNLPDADICTIDSYLTKFLRRNYHVVGLDPIFSVMSEDEKLNISRRVLKRILDKEFEEQNDDFILLCDTLGGKGARDLNDLIINCYEYARKYNDYQSFIKTWPHEYSLDEQGLENSKWMKEVVRSLTFELATALSYLELSHNYALLPGGPSNYVDNLKDEVDMLKSATTATTLMDLKAALSTIVFGRLPRKDKDADGDIVDKTKSLRDGAKKIVSSIQKSPALMPLSDIVSAHKMMALAISALSRLILTFDKEINKVKKRYKSLDFSDLMHYTLRTLEDNNTRNEEKERYQFIFVDEYQDTNQLQETLLSYISNGENLFCVGDVKQSIYSFRQAEPALFINRMDKSSTTFEGCDHLIPLSENFRSSNAVVDFINIVFDNVMTRKTGGVDYTGSELLKCRARRPDDEDENAKVELIVINAEEKNSDDELSNIEYEAIVAADIIEDVMSKPIYDGKKGTYRTAKFSDICLLSRSFKPIVRPVRRILEQRGIPITPLGQNGYLDELEIKTTFDILRIIDNHHRDVSLISAMHSPAFGFEIEELVAIRKKYNQKNVPFYKAVEQYSSKESDELSTKLVSFFKTVDRYRMLSRHMQLGEFIWHVLSDTMLYDAVGALPGGRIRQQNLRILAERADAFSMTPGRNLSSFLEHIQNMADSDSDFEPAGDTEANDTVKFMSIHKSKGLEFPVVILLNTASGGRPNSSSVIMSGGLTPGVKCYNPETMTRNTTLSHEASKSNDSFIENAERLRILYVALTRARERLCVLGTIGTGFEKRIQSWTLPKEGELLFGKPFLDIIASSAVRIKGNTFFGDNTEYDINNFHTKIVNAKDITHSKQRRKGAVLNAMEKAKGIPYMVDAFEFTYKKESFIPAKTSATSLLNATPLQYQDIEFLETPDFMQEVLGYDAAAKGTLTHTVMQFIDFKNDTNSIYKTIDSLIARNILPDDARDAVDVEAISRFLNSDIARRIRKSKVVKKEQPFVISLKACDIYKDTDSKKEVLIQGIIDLCFIEDDAWVIVDYKTNRVTPQNPPKIILEHYENQLQTYKKALSILTDIKVKESGIYLLSCDNDNAYLTL